MRYLLCSFLIGLAVISLAGCAKKPSHEEITLKAHDGAALSATVYPAQAATPPGILLIPRRSGDRQVWSGFSTFLQAMGYTVLAMDMPESKGDKNGPDMESLRADVESGRRVLLEKGADPKNLAVIGEGFGGLAALHFAVQEPSMQAVVVLSPGLEINGLNAMAAIEKLHDCPVLLITTQNDSYADSSAAAMKAAAPGFIEYQRFSGAAQGADIFAYHANAMHQIILWLQPIIGPPKTPS